MRSPRLLTANVEAVEKVQTEWFRSVNAKNDLSECARFDASTRGMGKRTPENKSIPASRTFSTASLAGIENRANRAMQIEPLQQVFMLFYAIFWGAIANVQPRWKPFQWHLFFAVPQARRRAIAALVALNILPLCFFAYGIWALYGRGPSESAPLAGSLHYLIRGVVPAFAIFGLYRFWFAMIELNPDCFYASTPEGLDEKYRHVEPTYQRKIENRDTPTVDLAGHGCMSFLSGAVYVIIALLAPWFPLP